MVKDGWVSSSYQEDTTVIDNNIYKYNYSPSKILDQQQTRQNVEVNQIGINPEPKDINVWGLYESKEKFLEMHF